jgi:transketolase
VENSAREHWAACVENGRELQEDWQKRFSLYQEQTPDVAAEFLKVISGTLPEDWDEEIPNLTAAENEDDEAKGWSGRGTLRESTRGWSGKVLQSVASRIPNLIGGSADLAESNQTIINGADDLLSSSPGGRNIHYGVREHAMASIMNGMALHGGVRPFGGTFLVFSDYMRPAIRLAALMGQSVIHVFTHDSIGFGENGPTHQPVEQLASLRAMPNLCDLRPGDAAETEIAWRVAIERTEGPSFLALTAQKVALLDRRGILAGAEGLRRGGYILAEASSGTPEVILIASGSELEIALEAREQLEAEGTLTRVVSLPSWYLFGRQEQSYCDSVLPPEISNKVSVEAASTFGWTRWVGESGYSLGLDHFGASAPAEVLFEKFGFTVENIVKAARNMAPL